MIAADSLSQNTITMLKGPAGSGKTYLSLGYNSETKLYCEKLLQDEFK